MSANVLSGIQLGMVSCETCGLLTRPPNVHKPGHCPRCGGELELRRRNPIERTWAFIIAAAICYIPANIMPVMITTSLTSVDADTIISGAVLLYHHGAWHLALIVLIASVMIPLAKLGALAYLLISVQRRSLKDQRGRTKLYRVLEFVGRWSMLDIFVVTCVVALIQLQPLMSVKPGLGALFFAAVVVLTMIAAETFDPRLIWDSSNIEEEQNE